MIERTKNGNFYGYPVAVIEKGQRLELGGDVQNSLEEHIERAVDLADQAMALQKQDIGAVNYELERLRLKERGYELDDALTPERKAELESKRQQLDQHYQGLEKQLFSLREQAGRDSVIVRDMRGEEVTLSLDSVLDVSYVNRMGFIDKVGHWFVGLGRFISDDPREANTEGGVFPAIFGTVFMVLLMAVIVTPFGVVAAIYLHEYAKKGPITKMIRIAVINLAGVPSIVYGVFGLGFFVYMLGARWISCSILRRCRRPPLALPGYLVGTDFGDSDPACGDSFYRRRLVTYSKLSASGQPGTGGHQGRNPVADYYPHGQPGDYDRLILAVARAAGEVAPLMLVGVVKLAPTLPVDMNFPFVHLERKFMHLGFHIYDVGFQSPNVEAARPLVYATSFLLVSVIVALNLTAISVRNHLREKYRSLEH